MNKKLLVLLLAGLMSLQINAQSIYEPVAISKVQSSLNEMGKMWTFDAVPLDYFEKEYNFRPTEDWLEDVMKSALQFGNGCSAAFVSADGLIMTNHHCGRQILPALSPDGKDYLRDGYYAENLSDELKTSNLFVAASNLFRPYEVPIHKIPFLSSLIAHIVLSLIEFGLLILFL